MKMQDWILQQIEKYGSAYVYDPDEDGGIIYGISQSEDDYYILNSYEIIHIETHGYDDEDSIFTIDVDGDLGAYESIDEMMEENSLKKLQRLSYEQIVEH